jgi:23S rRNA U2552 (ribose-2'-O)-methylase RlmE/FtsJ
VLILNYDFLRTDTHNDIVRFAERNHVNFVLLDEAHTCKQRGTTDMLTPGDVRDDGEFVSARRIELQGLLMALR